MTVEKQLLLDASYHPPITWSLPGILAERADATPQDVCLIDAVTDERVTFGALHEQAGRLGHGLQGLGIEAGDTIATMIPHSIDTYRIWFGLTHIGVLEVPISTKFKGRLLQHLLEDSNARALIIEADFLDDLRQVLSGVRLPHLRWVVVRGASEKIEALDQLEALTLDEVSRAGEAPAAGTDSWDREPHRAGHGALHLRYHRRVQGCARALGAGWLRGGWRLSGGDAQGRQRALLPVSAQPHWRAAASGCRNPSRTSRRHPRVVERLRVLGGDPPVRLHDHGLRFGDGEHPLEGAGHRRRCRQSNRRPPHAPGHRRVQGVQSRFGVRICTVFNMTEISIATQSGWDIDDPRSCGKARLGPPGYELRLVDENDYPVEVGEVGELVCRTDVPWSLNAGYFGRPQQTAEAWRNGWFHTGDAFRCDEQGRYYFVDRMKDAIRRRGENVSSFEVEREVSDHPDVVECAAIGVPAALGEEDIKVFVVTTPGSELTEAALIEHVAAKAASFMVPSHVEFVDELPKTQATERVKKAELRIHEAER